MATLNGTRSNDNLNGSATDDTVGGDNGSDLIHGLAGNDLLDGGTGADRIEGGEGNDNINGGTGEDLLYGGNGNDKLQGGGGSDRLFGDAGNDILDGGGGSDYPGGDYLFGGTGADVYLFGKGSGQDRISDYEGEADSVDADTILLGADLATTDVRLTRREDNLILTINSTGESLTVQSYFNNRNGLNKYVVENIQFADGTIWDAATVRTKVLIATAGNNYLYGDDTSITIDGGSGNDSIHGSTSDDLLDGGTGADRMYGNEGNDIIKGGAGNDIISGAIGNDNLQGGEGDDLLYGDAGNDTLDGGSGNDNLNDYGGSDVYLFGRGSGKDIVSNNNYFGTGDIDTDTILLGAGITASNLTFSRDSDDLIIRINDTDDSLRVDSYFYKDGAFSFTVDNIKFADGTTWNYATVKSNLSTVTPPVGITVSGTAADETLLGGLGNDTIYGSGGNDTLNGGAGNDKLDGGAGNDTYLFGKGSGKDIINAHDGTGRKLDVIQLGAGILNTDVTCRRVGDALLLSINGTIDTLRINKYFDDTLGDQVEQIKFADGTAWDATIVKTKIQTATSEEDLLYGYATNDTLSSLAGDDIVHGRAGNDTISGGSGADHIYGEDGDDLIKGGTQKDRLYGGNGMDNLQGQGGDDSLYGGAGNDTIDGGAGHDLLDGGEGNDTFLFGRGSGQDIMSDFDGTVGKLDTIRMGPGISANDVTLRRNEDALMLFINDTNDVLQINHYFYEDIAGGYQVEQISFADGTIWDIATVKAKVLIPTDENDSLYGYATNDLIQGLDGDDTIYAAAGNDTLSGGYGSDNLDGNDGNDLIEGGADNDWLYGGSGTDNLQGQSGNDWMAGNAGNDTLSGGTGNDIYFLDKGDNSDTINNYDSTGVENDKVQIGYYVTEDQIWLQRTGNDLQLTLIETNDKLTFSNWYSGSAYHVDSIELMDNSKHLLESQVDALVSAMSAFAPPAPGQTSLPEAYQATLNPVIAANWN